MASLVAFAPAPAIIGMRPFANSTVFSMTRTLSSMHKVAASPVVPTETIASVPELI